MRGADHPEMPARAIQRDKLALYEAALMGTKWRYRSTVGDPAHLAQLRPRPACSTHVLGDGGSELIAVQFAKR